MQAIIRFGVFELDRRAGELRKGGVRVSLRSQSLQVLTLLLDRAGDVVTREELQRHVWSSDTFVDFERGLNKAVNRLRDALGDTAASPRFIETLPKRGYRFIAPVQYATTAIAPFPQPAEQSLAARAVAGGQNNRAAPRTSVHWMVGGLTLLLVGVTGWALLANWRQTPASPLRLVLADFSNGTADPVFDDTLKQALIIDLEQSPALHIVADHEVKETLRLMEYAPDVRFTADVARDVCRRSSGDAVLEGSLDAVGREYVLGFEVTNCATGEPIAREQRRAARKEDVLAALDDASAAIRLKLGEAISSVQRFDMRVHQMLTTGSLDAFEAYTRGERNVFRQGGWSTVPFFERAIELDPQFAYAHAALGLVLGTMGEAARSSFHTAKAYQLRARVSEWERHFITAQYHDRVTGDLENALSTCDQWVQAYPDERTVHNRCASVYNQLGLPERALSALAQARRVGHDHPIDVDAWAATVMRLNRWDEARQVIRHALEQTPDRVPLRRIAYKLSFVVGTATDTAAHVEWAQHTPKAEALLTEHAETAAYFGRVDESRRLSQRAVDAALGNGFAGNAALWTGKDAVRQAFLGHGEDARAKAQAALALEANWETRALAALALARTGDTDGAARLSGDLSVERSESTLVQRYWLPVIRAATELHSGNPSPAIEVLQRAEPYELSDTSLPLLPAFVRGEAYLSIRDGRRAVAEFQKLLHHRGAVANSFLGALARLGVARAHVLTGETAQAKSDYESFFGLWREADSANELLARARAEYRAIPPQ